MNRKAHLLAHISISALSIGVGNTAFAQEAAAPSSAATSTDESAQGAELAPTDIIVTGTRQTGMRAADSPAPIEIVGAAALRRTGATDLALSLSASVPSLNVQTQGSNLASLAVQAALRGLGPNHTLILVDGKRRHTTANLSVDGGSAYSGAATTDLSFIPAGAIERVEVLTDGAASQYGTDAIAGVINVILKKSDSAGLFSVQGGSYGDGQGKTLSATLNKGFQLGEQGFVNVTLEKRYKDRSSHGIGDSRVTNPDGTPRSNLTFPNSNIVNAPNYPQINRLVGDATYNLYTALVNAGYDVGDDLHIYGWATYGNRVASKFANYRLPNRISGTTSTGQIVYPYPLGFSPEIKIKEQDFSTTAGLRGVASGWNWDLSLTYGANYAPIYVIKSANAQLFSILQSQSPAPIAPQADFYNGSFRAAQFTKSIDIDREFNVGFASPLNVAFGAEHRNERYTIKAGDPSSYFGSGAQSFAGYTPLDAGKHKRTNYAFYVELAADLFKGFHLNLAGRREHFSDFGNTTIGKATARYDFSPAIAIRGTVSTGFRAPTLAEEYYSGTSVAPTNANVVLPANSPAATVAGFAALKPEKSTNYSFGFVLHPAPKLQISIDAYRIVLKDRILPSGFLYGTRTIGGQIVTVSQIVLDAIRAKGATLESGLSYTGVSVFANAADSRTQGVEATASYASDFGDFGHVDWTVSANYNKNKFTRLAPLPAGVGNTTFGQTSFLTPNARTALTTSTPRMKVLLQAYWTLGRWDMNLRETIYGNMSQWSPNNTAMQKIGTTGITDLEINYRITDNLKFGIGANNLFDKRPPTQPTANGAPVGGGLVFDAPYRFAPWGINGGYYYARLSLNL